MANYKMRRGDGRTILLWAKDPITGARIVLNDKKVWFTAKRAITDLDAAAIIRKGTLNTGLTGIDIITPATPAEDGYGGEVARVAILAADTDDLTGLETVLEYDGQLATIGAQPQTIWSGTLLVVSDVTLTQS